MMPDEKRRVMGATKRSRNLCPPGRKQQEDEWRVIEQTARARRSGTNGRDSRGELSYVGNLQSGPHHYGHQNLGQCIYDMLEQICVNKARRLETISGGVELPD
jgi:hypothetical protein